MEQCKSERLTKRQKMIESEAESQRAERLAKHKEHMAAACAVETEEERVSRQARDRERHAAARAEEEVRSSRQARDCERHANARLDGEAYQAELQSRRTAYALRSAGFEFRQEIAAFCDQTCPKGSYPEQSLTQASPGGSKVKSEALEKADPPSALEIPAIFIKEEPEDETEDVSIKEEPEDETGEVSIKKEPFIYGNEACSTAHLSVRCAEYADDIAFFSSDADIVLATARVQTQLSAFCTWSQQWGL
ncbi:uncharacterized protein LOC125178435 [Hyalella azteca]|uniref:Uncharacterized protein LOC125178435 n=1 Tax=Hyalella azteca TaxID=294128 RepID=A0A979FM38_HYAAZ|nr:uncharacterized protein LOC125178435 [Hyalella azteca]